ncbi:LysR family transcriptional regulator [Faecalimonas umbilicata]|nr:LysR family transcriptional regulator [Faecalimonas umbilicata]
MLDKKVYYFITVVEEKSFSKAAQKMYLSQPNLSRQVKLLEEELGVKLLNRDGYRPVLTSAGEYYFNEIKKVQEYVEGIQNRLNTMEQQEIRIGFTSSFENRRILESLNMVKSQFDKVKLAFIKYNFEESLKRLVEGQIDISFGVESNFRKHPEVKYDVLYTYDICVICSFDHPFAELEYVTPEQLGKQDMVVLSRKNGVDFYNDFMEACKLDGYIPRVRKEVDTFDELVFEVSIGSGVAVVSKDVVRESEVKVIDFKDTHHASKYVIATLKKNDDSVVEAVVAEVKKYFLGNGN